MSVSTNSSSRTTVGTSTSTQKYVHTPIPSDVNLLSLYLSSELGNLSSTLTDILGGQILPILAESPDKLKEGTVVLFNDKVEEGGTVVIPEAGMYVYFKGKWNKITLTAV